MLLRSQVNSTSQFFSLELPTRRRRLARDLTYVAKWIRATASYNYFHNTDLQTKSEPNPFVEELSRKGISFEAFIIKNLSINSGRLIPTVSDIINDDTVNETIRLMKEGVPIIHSAPLRNPNTHQHGVADILVRSDKFHLFFNENLPREDRYRATKGTLPSENHPNNISSSYYYIGIDIKFRTFQLKVDQQTPYDSPDFRAFRDQLWTYTAAVGLIQGYTPNFALLIGRQYMYRDNGEKVKIKSYDGKLARVNFTDESKELHKTALEWSKSSTKSDHSQANEDITQVWQCGVKHRERMLQIGVSSIYDIRCTADAMGFNGERAKVIQQILDINQPNESRLIYLNDITSRLPTRENEFFIDFELIPEVLLDTLDSKACLRHDRLFLVGIVYLNPNGGWEYKSFVAETKSLQDERKLILSVIEFLRSNPTLYHWGHVENSTWKRLLERHHLTHLTLDYNWVDVNRIFISTPVVLKGCFNFRLKAIASKMHQYGMIKSKWGSGEGDSIMSGTECAMVAYQIYSADKMDKVRLESLIQYNEVDCRVLSEIVEFVRINKTF